MSVDLFGSVVNDLYASLLHVDPLVSALDAICRAVGGEHALMLRHGPDCAPECATSHQIVETDRQALSELGLSSDFKRTLSNVRTGSVIRMTSMLARDEILRNEVYLRTLRPINGGLAAISVQGDGEGIIEMMICRSASHDEDFSDDSLALLRSCLPHFVSVCSVARRLHRANAERTRACDALDLVDDGVIVLGKTGALLQLNSAADLLLTKGHYIRRATGGIAAVNPDDDLRLQMAIRAVRVLHGRTDAGTAVREPTQVVLGRALLDWLLIATVLPAQSGFLADISSTLMILHQSDPGAARLLSTKTLRLEFGLTRQEAALAQRLAHGNTLQLAADRLALSTETARQYLKIVFNKVGVHSQADLLRIIRR